MKKPTPLSALQARIHTLRVRKEMQEQEIAVSLQLIMNSLTPSSLAKDAFHDLADDRDVQTGAAGAALKFGSRFLVFKVIGRFGGVFGAVAAAVAGSLSDQYVDKTTPKLLDKAVDFFKKLRRKKPAGAEKNETRTEPQDPDNVHMHI